MTEPTLIPEQFQANPEAVLWTKIQGTYGGVLSYTLFDSTQWATWKAWADVNGTFDQRMWDGSEHVIAFKWDATKTCVTDTNEWRPDERNGWCLHSVSGGERNNPGHCIMMNNYELTWNYNYW